MGDRGLVYAVKVDPIEHFRVGVKRGRPAHGPSKGRAFNEGQPQAFSLESDVSVRKSSKTMADKPMVGENELYFPCERLVQTAGLVSISPSPLARLQQRTQLPPDTQ